MINAREAYDIMNNSIKATQKIFYMSELPNCFVFGINSEDGRDTYSANYPMVDKSNGKVGWIWIVDYAEEVDAGNEKEIDISQFELDKVS
nr:MAG TPA: hypothetical protein [Bacteriophage sp.]